MHPTTIEIIATVLFVVALGHTFSTGFFERLAHRDTSHSELFHLLGEVEIVFGFWAMVLALIYFGLSGREEASAYLDSRNFTEPLFVFVIMVIAGTKPMLSIIGGSTRTIGRIALPGSDVGVFFLAMSILPLLGSFITEPAAMTVSALILKEQFFDRGLSKRFMYATLAVLFVNVSIGGTLTPFAAPPVLMVAGKWGWTTSFMLSHFGWKAALAVFVNALTLTLIFRKQLRDLVQNSETVLPNIPFTVIAANILFLVGVVLFAHEPKVFIGIFMLFLGFTAAYPQFQDRLLLREGLLVAFFLAGLVVLGGQQQWWLEFLLGMMNNTAVFFGATALTAVTDNAALTYLGSLVEGLSPEFKYALVAGAVSGGGLTVIANAPNPAGYSLLRSNFPDGSISPMTLFLYALPPTVVAMAAFWFF